MKKMKLEFQLLAERPDAVLTVANWLHGEWGQEVEGSSPEKLAEGIVSRVSVDQFPMHVIAIQGNEIVGFGALKIRVMKIYEDREHWLGSLVVPGEHRGKGIGSALINEIVRRGRERGVSLLSLQTEELDGGLYSKLGWKPVEQVNYRGIEVLVMERLLRSNWVAGEVSLPSPHTTTRLSPPNSGHTGPYPAVPRRSEE
ncbi:MAG: GNAT family N-acetyltransferase [Opitutales bacterium]|nr:GNAT family N-acetyltransferase [Opitutales bacterium]